MAGRTPTLLLTAANILIPIAILTFASGFFPYKPFLAGLAEYEVLDSVPPPAAPFDKVVFMVVDALRSDFVYSGLSGFSFTQNLISSGAAMPFTAHATSPTITMPRIKAITTGSIPSFLDVILNFAESDTTSSLSSQDTWLAQMKAKGSGKMVMYGDDTWLKLFPETFDRTDGTSSFFVSDFTEVDNNVTRHVPEELKHDDWNTMVLHYLGLDHIGHKTGPRGPNMIPKQREMDGIVKQIYNAIETKKSLESTLLILCGDHGMNDAGNHGGSALGETSPALVFMSPKLATISSGLDSPAPLQDDFQYYTNVEQSDIVPTLGALLGFPVPRNNLGAIIPDFLPFWPDRSDKVQILLRNAKQILSVITATFPSFESQVVSLDCHEGVSGVDKLACQWGEILRGMDALESGDAAKAWLLAVSKWLKEAQELMSSTASNYDIPRLIIGLSISALATLLAFTTAYPTLTTSLTASSPFVVTSLLYGIMMFASSYVEEEQHFWYWSATAWVALLSIKGTGVRRPSKKFYFLTTIAILIIARIARRWNQTGQKFAGEPDIARTFFSEHRSILWAAVLAAYLWNLRSLASHGFPKFSQNIARIIATVLATASATFKLAFTSQDSPELIASSKGLLAAASVTISLVAQARLVFIAIGITLSYTLITGFGLSRRPNPTMRTVHDLLVLFLITQSRATNITLLLLFDIALLILNNLDLTLVEITTTSLFFQYLSFFAFGGSNAISSIDLSSAYNGVSGYNIIAVGFLTFISNWAGPVFWTSATNLMLLRLHSKKQNNVLRQHLALLTMFVASSLFFVMAACTLLRTHLFIWTVFSPKYLYSMAWSLGQHLAMNVSFGSLLFWLGTKYAS